MIENKFSKVYPYAFSNELDFMFVAEYLNGTLLFEYNPEEKYYISIKEVENRSNILHFGLVGHGVRTYYEIPTGIFYFDKNKIEILYKTKDKEYSLTNQLQLYNDIIYFKDAYSEFNMLTHRGGCNFYGYNYGYKTKINFSDGTEFYFKPIINIPLKQPVNFKIWLVCNKNLDGEIIIKINDIKSHKIHAPLDKNIGGELTWILKE